MGKCFVIQPFDGAKFDKRYNDVYRPAIEASGQTPYRVDQDPKVEITISAIEDGIRDAAICLADISTDNPNVWYELGFAFAAKRPVVMVCAEDRRGKFPFDIQHRTIIKYKSESTSDFESLRKSLTEKIKALLSKKEAMRQIAEKEQVAPTKGLSQLEIIVLAQLAGMSPVPGSTAAVYALQNESEKIGLTAIGFSLGIRRLLKKKYISLGSESDGSNYGDPYVVAIITPEGWDWIEQNEPLFNVKSKPKGDDLEEVPF